jgi:hypothetical protein
MGWLDRERIILGPGGGPARIPGKALTKCQTREDGTTGTNRNPHHHKKRWDHAIIYPSMPSYLWSLP